MLILQPYKHISNSLLYPRFIASSFLSVTFVGILRFRFKCRAILFLILFYDHCRQDLESFISTIFWQCLIQNRFCSTPHTTLSCTDFVPSFWVNVFFKVGNLRNGLFSTSFVSRGSFSNTVKWFHCLICLFMQQTPKLN